MPTWSVDGDTLRCDRHGVTVTALEPCAQCELDPGPAIDVREVEALPAAPAGCETTEDHERAFTAIARYSEKLARRVAKGGKGEEPNPSLSAKILDAAIKARRAASALARDRQDLALVERLEPIAQKLVEGRKVRH